MIRILISAAVLVLFDFTNDFPAYSGWVFESNPPEYGWKMCFLESHNYGGLLCIGLFILH